MHASVLLDEQPVTEQATLIEQVIDKIPGEIHEFMDRSSTVGAIMVPWSSRVPAGRRTRACVPAREGTLEVRLGAMEADWGIQ